MTRLEQVGRGLYAAWRFLLLDQDAAHFIRPSGQGVLLSFWALVIVIPAYALQVWVIGQDPSASDFSRIPIWLLTAGYVITWPFFALLMFYLLPSVDKGHTYIYFMPIYNWGKMIGLFMAYPVYILIGAGVLPSAWHNISLLITAVLVLSYKTFIVRRTTGVSIFHAIIFVSLDVLMVMMVEWSMRDAFSAVN